MLALIQTFKIVKIYVKLFFLRGDLILSVFYLEIATKNIFDLDKIFCFGLILSFGMIFWVF